MTARLRPSHHTHETETRDLLDYPMGDRHLQFLQNAGLFELHTSTLSSPLVHLLDRLGTAVSISHGHLHGKSTSRKCSNRILSLRSG